MKKNRNLILAFLLILLAAMSGYAAGEVDPTFNAAAYVYYSSGARVLLVQPDGKILVGGTFSVVHGVAHHGLVRINQDGSLDPTFDAPTINPAILNPLQGGRVLAIALQSDGKILVGGAFTIIGSNYHHIMRLNPDGSIDNSFNNFNSNVVEKISVLPDNSFFVLTGTVAKYDANGFPFPGFQFMGTGSLRGLETLPDGRFYVSDVGVTRYNANGSTDGTFSVSNSNGRITEIVVPPDGKILVGGDFTTLGGSAAGNIARLNTDGSRDLTFNTGGSGANDQIDDIELAPDGKIFINGEFSAYNFFSTIRVAKLNANGTVDNSFVSSLPQVPQNQGDVDVLPNGNVVVAGNGLGTTAAPTSVVMLKPDGTRDNDFVFRSGAPGRIRKVIQQADGKVVIVGEFPLINGAARNSMARLNSDGSLDAGFVPFFNNFPAQQVIHALALLPDGKILIGAAQGILMSRLNPDGTRDTTFNATLQSSSLIYDMFVQPDGKILITGEIGFVGDPQVNSRRSARLNADGSTDSSFNPPDQPNYAVYRVIGQPDGKVLICGEFTQIGSTVRGRVARLNTDGTLDISFNPPGGANNSVYDMALQTDGKVVLVGAFTALNDGSAQVRIGRLNPDGSLDTDFAQTANTNVNSVKIQSDGKILIGGVFTSISGVPRNLLARLNSNGSIDTSFNASATATVLDISMQTDNQILVAGEFTEINNVSRLAVARLLNNALPPRRLFDYDGDGKADVSVFRPSENRWYVLRSSDFGVTQQVFAIPGDVPVPADYDGDGKTDFAIFRPSSGDWWSLSSLNGNQVFAHWGQNGDIPRPSDFDGDGRADYVVFRPSNNFWYRISSANGAASNQAFGLAGDKPVIADFDGDGKSDKAIYRPSTGDWWWQSSEDNVQRATHWGISTDIPSPADFDGDGKTDFAVYRPSTGIWYIFNSSDFSATIINFGLAEDKPVAADYDGDGKADIAVFRPSNGAWYIMQTTAGFWGAYWGISTDIPTENAFVP